MDTENFILRRNGFLQRLEDRRRKDLSNYPFRIAKDHGVNLPSWARVALSLAGGGGVLSRVLEIGLPLAIPFVMKRQAPTWGRLVQRFFSPKT